MKPNITRAFLVFSSNLRRGAIIIPRDDQEKAKTYSEVEILGTTHLVVSSTAVDIPGEVIQDKTFKQIDDIHSWFETDGPIKVKDFSKQEFILQKNNKENELVSRLDGKLLSKKQSGPMVYCDEEIPNL